MKGVPPHVSRLIACVIAAMLVIMAAAAFWAVFVAPLEERTSELRNRLHALERYQAIVSSKAGAERRLRVLEQTETSYTGYVTATTPAQASAALQQVLAEMAEFSDARVASVDFLSQTGKETLMLDKVGVRVNLEIAEERLEQFLIALAGQSAPVMWLSRLEVRGAQARFTRPADSETLLRIILEVEAPASWQGRS